MNWKAHSIIGAIVTAVFVIFFHIKLQWFDFKSILFWFEILIVALISPLISDLDSEQGKLHQVLIGLGLALGLVGTAGWFFATQLKWTFIQNYWIFPLVVGVFVAGATFFVGEFAHHRGFLHSICFCVLYAFVVYLVTIFNYQMAIVSLITAYSHLVSDLIPFKIR